MGRWTYLSGMSLSLLVACSGMEPPKPPDAPRPTATAAATPDGPPVFVPQRVPETLWEASWITGDRAVVIADPTEGVFVVDAATGHVRAVVRALAQDLAVKSEPPTLFLLTTNGDWVRRFSLSDGQSTAFPIADGDAGSAFGLHRRGEALHVLTMRTLSFLDAKSGALLGSLPAPQGGYSVGVYPGGESLVLTAYRSLRVLDPRGEARFEVEKTAEEIRGHAVSPDARRLAVLRSRSVSLHDAQTGALVSQGHEPCGTRRTVTVAFAPDGKSIVALCAPELVSGAVMPAEVRVTGLDFESPRVIGVGDPTGSFDTLRFSGDGERLAILGDDGDAVIFAYPSGERLGSLDPRCAARTTRRPCVVAWNGALDRALVSEMTADGSDRTGPRIVGRDGKPITPLGTFSRGPLKRDPYVPRDANGLIDAAPTEPKPSARFRLGFPNYIPEVTDTKTLQRIPLDPPGKEGGRNAEMNGISLSPRQTFTIGVRTATMPSGLASNVIVWRTETGKRLLDLSARGYADYVVASDESRIAVLAPGCVGGSSCYEVTVYELPSGKRVSSFRTTAYGGMSPALSADATMLALGLGVHDTNTGRILYEVSFADDLLLGWVRGSQNIAALRAGRLVIVEPRSRAVVRSAEAAGVVEVRGDGKAVLLRREGARHAVLHLDDGHVWDVPSDPMGLIPVGFAGDNDVVHLARTASSLDAHGGVEVRASDGRVLHHHGELVVTDQGVFDGPEEAWFEGAFRMGPDLLSARMAPLRELASRFHRPGLRAAFLAGEDVSPGARPSRGPEDTRGPPR
jgi:hypothetical protein